MSKHFNGESAPQNKLEEAPNKHVFGEEMVVSCHLLNVRSEPSRYSNIVKQIPNGTKVYCDWTGDDMDHPGVLWAHVEFRDGEELVKGFAMIEYLEQFPLARV